MAKTIFDFIESRRYFILVLLLAWIGWATFGLSKLRLDMDYKSYLSKKDRSSLEEIEQVYVKDMNVFIALEAKDTVFSPGHLSVLEALTKEAWQTPYSSRVDSLANFQLLKANGDDLSSSDLIRNANTLSAQEIAEIEKTARSDQRLIRKLVSDDGRMTAVNIQINVPGEDQEKINEVMAFVETLKKKYESPEIKFYISGASALSHALFKATMHDLTTFVPAMFIILFFLLGWLLQSKSAVFITLLVLNVSLAITIGLCGWLGIPITSTSALAPNLILTVGVSDCVHFFVAFLRNFDAGQSRVEAVKNSFVYNIKPMALSCFTNAVGFFALNLNQSPNFQDLGNMVAVGLAMLYLCTMVLMPILLLILPIKPKALRASKKQGRQVQHVRLGEFIIRNHKKLLVGNLVATIFFGYFAFRNKFDENFLDLLDKSVPFRRESDVISTKLIGLHTIMYNFNSGIAEGVKNPKFLKDLDRLAEWFRNQPEVGQVSSISDTFKKLNRAMNADKAEMERIPDDANLAAQYLLLYEMSLPFGLDLNSTLNVDKSATRFIVHLKNISNSEILNIVDRAQKFIDENMSTAFKNSSGSSGSVAFAKATENNIWSGLLGALFSFCIISVTLSIAFKNLRYGVLAMLPNITPLLFALGLWGLFHGRVGLAVSGIIQCMIGIVVDDTVHFMSHYLERRSKGHDAKVSLRHTYTSVGDGLWTASIVLAVGFGILILSPFTMNSHMGWISSLSILFGLSTEYFLMAPLLLQFDQGASQVDGPSPK